MKVSYCLILQFLISISYLFASKDNDIQTLHKSISDELLNLRKQYPQTQPIVYSLLDQVCKMYRVSKNALEKKSNLKQIVKNKTIENKLLKSENLNLKNELNSLKNELNANLKNLNSVAKKLEQKNTMLSMLTKEKQKILNEKSKLEEEKKIFLKSDKFEKNKNNEFVENKYNSNQSLNLTSTCAPNSPL
ncbi:hypothetical protein GF322_05070 [Candidatus Dependentiae bacterium]|nr:hypothetical protein [Candidatus Dependentiae bacterium]